MPPWIGPRPAAVERLGQLVAVGLLTGQQGQDAEVEHPAQPLPATVEIHGGTLVAPSRWRNNLLRQRGITVAGGPIPGSAVR